MDVFELKGHGERQRSNESCKTVQMDKQNSLYTVKSCLGLPWTVISSQRITTIQLWHYLIGSIAGVMGQVHMKVESALFHFCLSRCFSESDQQLEFARHPSFSTESLALWGLKPCLLYPVLSCPVLSCPVLAYTILLYVTLTWNLVYIYHREDLFFWLVVGEGFSLVS